MFHPQNQLPNHTNPSPPQDSPTLIQVENDDTKGVGGEGMQNGISESDYLVFYSKKLQDELHVLGRKIKEHEDNLKMLSLERTKFDEIIVELQVTLGKFHSGTSGIKNDHSDLQSEEETINQIIQHEKSAAGVMCLLKTRHCAQASHLSLTKGVVGIVAQLAKVNDENLRRLLSEYLGVDTMLAIVCNTSDGVKGLETYDDKGCIDKSSGLHGLAASIGRVINDRFTVISLENLRPFSGNFVDDDPMRRLDLMAPRFANGEIPTGFIGYAVNLIDIDIKNLYHVTEKGRGLRETLFYNLISRLQVYRTRTEMLHALALITDGAVSLDGGIINKAGVFTLGSRENVEVMFPKSSGMSDFDKSAEIEKQIQEVTWQKEKSEADVKRELSMLNKARSNFSAKKSEFVQFLQQSSNFASQNMQASQGRLTPR